MSSYQSATCPVCGDDTDWCRRSLEEARKSASAHYMWAISTMGADGLTQWERELLAQSEDPA